MKIHLCLFVLLPAVVSCSSGGDSGGGSNLAFCSAISGGGTNTSSIAQSCNNCSIDNKDQSIDDNLGTAATMHVGAGSSGELALRVNAQSGVLFPAGYKAGFVIAGADDSSLPLVRTLLNGTDQEDSQLSKMTATSNGQTLIFFTTSKQFNSIEAVLPGDGAVVGGQDRTLSVYEFCSQ